MGIKKGIPVLDNKSLTHFFNGIFENSLLGIALLSSEGYITAANKTFLDLLQYSDNEIKNITLESITDEIDLNELKNLSSAGSHLTGVTDIRIQRKDRTYFWARANISHIDSCENKEYSSIIQVQDITELKEAEFKYSYEINLLPKLINTIPDNIFVKDANSRFLLANKWVASIMGVKTPDELIGKTDFNFYPSKMAQKFYNDEQEIIKTGIPKINIVEKVLNRTKGILYYSTTKVPLKNNQGNIIGIMGIGRDITRSIKEKKQLRRAKIEAERADKLKTAFLANISHEIRTPLNGILGFSQFLKNNNLPQEKKTKFLDIILFNGKLLLDLINDIIDISKIDSGQITVVSKTFCLNELMKILYNNYTAEIKNKVKKNVKLKLNIELSDENSIISTDDFKVRKILMNLLSNALKFTNKGLIEFGYNVIEDRMIQFYVKDTGIGIHKSNQDIIFDRFRQVDESLTRKYGGAGLGLSISRELVTILGGEMWVESVPKKGSVFYFTLPLKRKKN
jgi:PAS domain S-box-containing protein